MQLPNDRYPDHPSTSSHIPPTTLLPVPKLKYIFSLRCEISPRLTIGQGPYGLRAHVPIVGGNFWGLHGLNGRVVNGGADDMIVVDSVRTRIDTRYLLQIEAEGDEEGKRGEGDGALIYIRTRGGRAGTPEMVRRLEAGEESKKEDWNSYLSVVLETGHEKYRWLNDHTIVAYMRKIDGDVCYDAYLVDAYE